MEYSMTKLIEEAIRQSSISSLSIDFRYSHMARKTFFNSLLLSLCTAYHGIIVNLIESVSLDFSISMCENVVVKTIL